MSIYAIFYLLFAHWIADFVLQTEQQATKKATDMFYLMDHVINYSAVMTFFAAVGMVMVGHFDITRLAVFTVITFSAHSVTDYFTSKLNAKLWKKGDTHNFFVSIGFDQVLHYVQLILTCTYILR